MCLCKLRLCRGGFGACPLGGCYRCGKFAARTFQLFQGRCVLARGSGERGPVFREILLKRRELRLRGFEPLPQNIQLTELFLRGNRSMA